MFQQATATIDDRHRDFFAAAGDARQVWARRPDQPPPAVFFLPDGGVTDDIRRQCAAGELVCPMEDCPDPRFIARGGALRRHHFARRLADGRTVEAEQLLERMRRTHARARSLVDGVLEYARSGTSRTADAVDTHELKADVAASLANAVERLHGRLEIFALPTVRADRAQLGRVLQNLVANGLKFHSQEPPHIIVSAERHDAAWVFNVRDNGVGVPPELGDEMFSMFKRAHGDEVEGCGIGLAVCRKIVEAHGGDIWAEPADGSGTVMRFTIPATSPLT